MAWPVPGSVSFLSSSMAYGWLSPLIGLLTSEFQADSGQITNLALVIELGCLVTSCLSIRLMDRLGRKWPMVCTAPLFMVSWALTLTAGSVRVLYVKRLSEGLAMGVLFSVGPVYLAEVASPEVRGAVLLSISVSWYAGIFLQYCLGTYLSYAAAAWVNLALPVAALALLLPLPESPYYLLMRARPREALAALAWLRCARPHEVRAELDSMAQYLARDVRDHLSLGAALRDPVYQQCFGVMTVVILGTVLTGVTAIYSFATDIFAETSRGLLTRDTCPLVLAGLLLALSGVTCVVIDRVGRRPLLVATSLGCCLSNAASALYFYYRPAQYDWVPLVTVGCYCVSVSLGMSPVMVVFQGELFPTSVRALGAGLAQVLITACSLLVLRLYLPLKTSLGEHANYTLYAAVGALATVYLYFYAPETKNKTFSEMFKDQASAPSLKDLTTAASLELKDLTTASSLELRGLTKASSLELRDLTIASSLINNN